MAKPLATAGSNPNTTLRRTRAHFVSKPTDGQLDTSRINHYRRAGSALLRLGEQLHNCRVQHPRRQRLGVPKLIEPSQTMQT